MQNSILVIDSYRDNADSLSDLLNLYGYNCKAAYGSRQAIEALKNFTADAIIISIDLDDKHEIAKIINEDTKLIFMSKTRHDKTIEELRHHKPVTENDHEDDVMLLQEAFNKSN